MLSNLLVIKSELFCRYCKSQRLDLDIDVVLLKDLSFATHSDFQFPISLQLNIVDLSYFYEFWKIE